MRQFLRTSRRIEMLVENVMTSPVIGVEPSSSIVDAAKIMLHHHSGLPVIDHDGRPVGIVTEGDFLRRGELGTERQRPRWLELLIGSGRIADEYVHTHGRKVEEVMSDEVLTTTRRAPIKEVVDTMMRRHIKRLPVVEAGRIVGIVARSDILRALAAALPGEDGGARSDAGIRTAILAELGKQPWTGLGSIQVQVKDAAVELHGMIFDDRQRRAIQVLAENVAGVKSVHDDLVWIEPISGTVSEPRDGTAEIDG
ncbi:MAG: CBS domain-containing protein [Devosia sp.]